MIFGTFSNHTWQHDHLVLHRQYRAKVDKENTKHKKKKKMEGKGLQSSVHVPYASQHLLSWAVYILFAITTSASKNSLKKK